MVSSSNIELISTTTALSTLEDVYLVDASGGGFTITLSDITADGIHYKLIRIDEPSTSPPSGAVTVQGFAGAQTINGAVSVTLSPGGILGLESHGIDDGTGGVWYISTFHTVGITLPYTTIFTTQSNKFISIFP